VGVNQISNNYCPKKFYSKGPWRKWWREKSLPCSILV
jgi:hypothetical protein